MESSGLRLAELIAALSLATDLAMGQPMEHALRTCLLAVSLGELLGLDDAELNDVYYVALLRAVGCTADPHDLAALFGDEMAAQATMATIDHGDAPAMLGFILRNAGAGQPPLRRAQTLASALATGLGKAKHGAVVHCEVAQHLAARLGLGSGTQHALGMVFERWNGRGLSGRHQGEGIPRPMRIVHLARDAEVFLRIGGLDAAVTVARDRAGTAYDPALVETFTHHAARLQARLEARPAWEAAMDAEPGRRRWLSETELDTAARAIADFADMKSWYTVGHSSGVATLAAEAARQCRLPDADVVSVYRAGLLHDVGRAGVSAAVWSRAAPLREAERERVRLHPYYTERVLARPRALAHLGTLASLHHERLDGSGYHRGLPAALQPPAARLLAAADTYHAMTEPRPHRPPLSPTAASEELRRDVRAGRLDGEAATAVLAAAGHRVRPVRHEWPAGLSDREVEVLRLAGRGLSRREMSAALTISERTVAHHLQHIYDKIGVSTRAAATLFALQHDLLTAT
jgi:HD-GYP domain-containing protein (c-di-GMP phosphodiesterase class II)